MSRVADGSTSSTSSGGSGGSSTSSQTASNGVVHGLRYVVGPENWVKLSQAVANPLTATSAHGAHQTDRSTLYQ